MPKTLAVSGGSFNDSSILSMIWDTVVNRPDANVIVKFSCIVYTQRVTAVGSVCG